MITKQNIHGNTTLLALTFDQLMEVVKTEPFCSLPSVVCFAEYLRQTYDATQDPEFRGRVRATLYLTLLNIRDVLKDLVHLFPDEPTQEKQCDNTSI